MKLLILLIAMGVIGVIGTVEYIQAQTPTPLTITAINIPSSIDRVIELQSTAPTNTWMNNDANIRNTDDPKIGSIYGKSDPLLQPNSIFENAPIGSEECFSYLISAKYLINNNNRYQGIAVPDNIPDNSSTIHAIGFDFFSDANDVTAKCTPDLEAQTDGTAPLLMRDGKELRVIIDGKHDKKPYYFSPRDSILQAHPIPLCTTENFNTTTQTLKGKTQMCSGKNGNDMIIITKRVLGFYGTTETITTPTNTIDFNTGITITKQEKDYLELLKKLYLPAI